MPLKMLLVDESITMSLQKIQIEKDLGYQVDCAEKIEQARQLLNDNDYQALMIEPFVNKDTLGPNTPMIEFIREARERNIPVIISSAQLPTFLFESFKLVYGRDYQFFLEKPYFFDDIKVGLKKIVEGE